jgi:hypothetical protein
VNKQPWSRYRRRSCATENAKFADFVAKIRPHGSDLPRLLQLYTDEKQPARTARYRELLAQSRSEFPEVPSAMNKPALVNLPAYQQTGTRMIGELNKAAAGAYRADALDLHAELEAESGRWSVLVSGLQADAPVIHAQELTEYEKKLAKMDAEARAHNAKLARESSATDGAGRPWGSLYDQNLPDYQEVKPYIKRYPIENATGRMAEVEARCSRPATWAIRPWHARCTSRPGRNCAPRSTRSTPRPWKQCAKGSPTTASAPPSKGHAEMAGQRSCDRGRPVQRAERKAAGIL